MSIRTQSLVKANFDWPQMRHWQVDQRLRMRPKLKLRPKLRVRKVVVASSLAFRCLFYFFVRCSTLTWSKMTFGDSWLRGNGRSGNEIRFADISTGFFVYGGIWEGVFGIEWTRLTNWMDILFLNLSKKTKFRQTKKILFFKGDKK